jgi:hypothetical protein
VTTFVQSTSWKLGTEEADGLPADPCPNGQGPAWVETWKEPLPASLRSGSNATDLDTLPPSFDAPSERLSRTDYPVEFQSDPVARQCWVDGLTVCETTVPPGGGPATITDPRTGQSTEIAIPGPATAVQPAVQEVAENWPEPNPSPTTVPQTTATTTVGPTTTIPAPTTTVPQVPCPPGEPAPGCVPDEADGGGNECWPSGWGWLNPLEWVLKPIKCAARWLFVPPQPEFRNALDEMYELTEEPPLQWAGGLIDVATSSSAEFVAMRNLSLPCVPNLGTSVEFCAEDLDAGNLPSWLSNAVLVGLWLLLAYAVVRFL